MTGHSEAARLQSLVKNARRRVLVQLLATQALIALTIGAGGLVLLLVLGTQVLDWYWPLLLGAASFGYLVWRVRGHIPSEYRVAQIVDAKLGTADVLSSGYHFLGHGRTATRDGLIEEADRVAAGIAPQTAVPFAAPRGWWRAAAVSAAALSLLVFRYAFQSSLDLERPIAPGLYTLLASGEKPRELARNRAEDPDALPLEGMTVTEAQKSLMEKGIEKGQEIETEAANSTESAASGQKPGQFQQSMSPSEEGEQAEGAEKGEKASGENSKDGASNEEKKPDGEDAAKKNANPAPKQGNPEGGKSSLMDKFKDAMANLMNKMKSQDKNQGQQQSAKDNQQQGQQGSGQQEQKNSKGQEAQAKNQQASGQQQADQQGQQQGDGGEKSPSQQAKGGDQGNQPPQSDAKSGMGKQDGNKSIEFARQQEAMGKISELFGKRAQNIQGEIMIEVSSSKSQALKTGYSGKTAGHSDTAGVIRRDEVPIELQNYVQKYFEELRKSPAPAPASTSGSSRPPANP